MYAWQNLSVLYGQMPLCLFAFDSSNVNSWTHPAWPAPVRTHLLYRFEIRQTTTRFGIYDTDVNKKQSRQFETNQNAFYHDNSEKIQITLSHGGFDLLESSWASGPDTFTIQVLFERFSKWVLPCFQHLPIQIQLGKHSAGVGFLMVPGYWLSSFIIFNPSQHTVSESQHSQLFSPPAVLRAECPAAQLHHPEGPCDRSQSQHEIRGEWERKDMAMTGNGLI